MPGQAITDFETIRARRAHFLIADGQLDTALWYGVGGRPHIETYPTVSTKGTPRVSVKQDKPTTILEQRGLGGMTSRWEPMFWPQIRESQGFAELKTTDVASLNWTDVYATWMAPRP